MTRSLATHSHSPQSSRVSSRAQSLDPSSFSLVSTRTSTSMPTTNRSKHLHKGQPISSSHPHINLRVLPIKSWLTQNFLKLNRNKTELLLIGIKSSLSKTGPTSLSMDATSIIPSTQPTLGSSWTPPFPLNTVSSQSSKPPSITFTTLAKSDTASPTLLLNPLIHTSISSHLDCCNSVL